MSLFLLACVLGVVNVDFGRCYDGAEAQETLNSHLAPDDEVADFSPIACEWL